MLSLSNFIPINHAAVDAGLPMKCSYFIVMNKSFHIERLMIVTIKIEQEYRSHPGFLAGSAPILYLNTVDQSVDL